MPPGVEARPQSAKGRPVEVNAMAKHAAPSGASAVLANLDKMLPDLDALY